MEGFVEVIVVEVGFELSGDSSLKDFGQEGEVGYGPVVVGDVRVETRFF